MTKIFYTPALTSENGYLIISPTRNGEELTISGGYVFNGWSSYKIGSKAFETIEEARNQAEKMRKSKIASLQKQIAKLESLDFS